jgi:hypothetical protein
LDAVEYFKDIQCNPNFDKSGYAWLLPLKTASANREHFLGTIPGIIAMALAR